MGSPSVGQNLEGLAQACGFKQNVAQPRCIGPLKIEGIAENAMPCADLAGATGSGNSPQFCEYRGSPHRYAADASSWRQIGFTAATPQAHQQW
jgi:hypothetical protein